MTFTICHAEQLRSILRLNADGSVTWLAPSKYHRELTGSEAGSPIPKAGSRRVYWAVQIMGRKVKRSHIVFCLTHGRWPELQIDHINGNSLDDRPSNLREATAMQNAWNHKSRAKRSPLPMGVRVAVSGRFVARIGVNNKQITVGTFDTSEQAASAYRAARVEHFGEFA